MSIEMSPQTEAQLRKAFKAGNPFMLTMWRLGLGSWVNAWPEWGGRIMVLTHIGRKSGLKRRTPLNYAVVAGEVYCTAGFGAIADWYRNLTANPSVEVWLPNGWWEGVAEEVTDETRRLPLMREVLIASGFAARAAGINPKTMSDSALTDATREYKLIHIRRTAARTGEGGPGDLAWMWPVAAVVLGWMLLWRRRGNGRNKCC